MSPLLPILLALLLTACGGAEDCTDIHGPPELECMKRAPERPGRDTSI